MVKIMKYQVTAKGLNSGNIAAQWNTNNKMKAIEMFIEYVEAYSNGINQVYQYNITLKENDNVIKRAIILNK